MIRLLRFLITGDWHLHKWETISHHRCVDDSGSEWIRFHCRCTICGQHKKFE